jgi:hypothetical protein
MTWIYIDESGDLGFSDKASKHFIITAVKIADERTNTLFRRIPKEIREKTLTKPARKCNELKFSNSSPLIRERFLTRAAKLDVTVFSLIVKKERTKLSLRENLPVLYQYLIKMLLENVLRGEEGHELIIFLDRCMSSSQREHFESYIRTEFFALFKEAPLLRIVHEDSCDNPGLQVVDFVTGSFGYKYNTLPSQRSHDKDHYLAIIAQRVIVEKTAFSER